MTFSFFFIILSLLPHTSVGLFFIPPRIIFNALKSKTSITVARIQSSNFLDPIHDPDHYKNGDILRAAKGQLKPGSPTPLWMMRQAGRYLAEFRELRRKHSFLEICHSPELASIITLQPLGRYPELGAVIIFSDILVIPAAMNQTFHMEDGKGPVFDWNLENPADISKLDLKPNTESQLGYVFDAIHLTYKKVKQKVPIIGFCGAPLTLFAYMTEGSSSKSWFKTKKWLYDYPEEAHSLLSSLTDVAVSYLVGQYDAGAPILQVFDTLAGSFTPHLYSSFGAPYLRKIASEVKRLRPKATLIGFPKDQVARLGDSDFDVLSVSWTEDPVMVRAAHPTKTLQGNLDPAVLFSSPEVIKKETLEMMKRFERHRYIANLGHGMEPTMDPENVAIFIRTVNEAGSE